MDSLMAPDGRGRTAWVVQVVPFQAAAKAPALDSPTASQELSGAHDTEVSEVCVEPAGAETACDVQEVPSQPAAMAPSAGTGPLPTASQLLAETQDMPV